MNGHSGKASDEATVKRAVQLHIQGLTVTVIAKRLSVSTTSVRAWIKREAEKQGTRSHG